jgi:ketosteroid isomerase-like protein
VASENVATLTRIYDGWKRGDFTVSVGALAEDVTLIIDPEIPDSGVFEGLAGVRSYMTRFLEAWKSLTIEAVSFKEAGDSVLVEVRQAGVGHDSGVPVGLSYFQLWTFRDGSVIRIESIVRKEKALEAIGLSG